MVGVITTSRTILKGHSIRKAENRGSRERKTIGRGNVGRGKRGWFGGKHGQLTICIHMKKVHI